MARSVKAGGKRSAGKNPPKTHRGKGPHTRPKATQARRLERSSDSDLELEAAREQQAATAEILKLISQSAFDLQLVLETLVSSAVRLCEADTGIIRRREGDTYPLAATFGFSEEERAHFARYSVKPDRGSVFGRAILEMRSIHVPDLLADPELNPDRLQDYARAVTIRTGLGVPLLRDGTPIRVFTLQRRKRRPYTKTQIELVETFAHQAVIAIENTRLFKEVHSKSHDLQEALQYQSGSANILNVIASSPTDVSPVLQAIVKSACELCGAYDALVRLKDSTGLAFGAHHGPLPVSLDSVPLTENSTAGRAMMERQPVHVQDLLSTEGDRFPDAQALARLHGERTILSVPLLREGESIGAIVLRRAEVNPFTDKQIALLQTFADQAVIAIENTRLFNETKEALERQTATADVLNVIGRSPTDAAPVFDVIGERAEKLCNAEISVISVLDGDLIKLAGIRGISSDGVRLFRAQFPLGLDRQTVTSRTISSGQIVHVGDVLDDPTYDNKRLATDTGYRSCLGVPMHKKGEVVGAIFVARAEPGLFSDNQVQLLQIFADQAVIAIENTRLFNETKEALEQQTATTEVLEVINSSPGNLAPVFDAMLEKAIRLCDAVAGHFRTYDGNIFPLAAARGEQENVQAMQKRGPLIPGPHHPVSLFLRGENIIHLPNARESEWYRADESFRSLVDRGALSVLSVALRKDGLLLGYINVYRHVAGPFTDRQIALLQNFASQAVIAMENARLITQTREALEQQTATAEVLKVISRSAFDLQTVLDTLTESATELCHADMGSIARRDERGYYHATAYKFAVDWVRVVDPYRIQPGRESVIGRALIEEKAVQIADVLSDPEYNYPDMQKVAGYRTLLGVPLMRQGKPIGALFLGRKTVRPFTDKQIELVSTFADQAVIAISNVGLFEEVQARTRELTRSLEDLRTAQDRLVQTEKLASLGQLTAGIAHEIKNPLNFVNNFSAVSVELTDELRDVLRQEKLSDKGREETDELTSLLKENLGKVVQHGKRADSIVKNMLLHSRQGSGEHRPVDINAVVDESLNLAYHGARAENTGFNITIRRSFDPVAGTAEGYPQEIARALLNLISNGFYAAIKRKSDVGDRFDAVLTATTKNLGDKVEIRIRDNGTGIPKEVQEKIFNPFFTTKPAGEGTGLGLSMTHDIIVKQHGGSIEVDTEPGAFTEFIVTLPRTNSVQSPQRSTN